MAETHRIVVPEEIEELQNSSANLMAETYRIDVTEENEGPLSSNANLMAETNLIDVVGEVDAVGAGERVLLGSANWEGTCNYSMPNKNEEIEHRAKHHVECESSISEQSYDQDSKESPLLTRSWCIYKVPLPIRQVNEHAYTPQVVSIGPLHHNTERLKNMERHKKVLFKEFIKLSKKGHDYLLNLVRKLEPKVRACYSEDITLDRGKLANLILVDAGFIIVLFLGRLEEDSHLTIPCLRFELMMDLLLLENQLPFFIIEKLFNEAIPPCPFYHNPFLELTFKFFGKFNLQKLDPSPIKHFTDLFRNFYLYPHTVPSFVRPKNYELLYSANELHEARVKFEKIEDEKCLLNLKFSRRTLKIPKILIEDSTELIFRNIIAFEQLQYPYKPYIANYVKVLDYLINKSEDVDILIRQGVISNYLADSNDVAQLFNGLCKNVIFANFNSDYADICKSLNAFCENRWNNLMATLRRDYCKTPWQIVASIAGIVLLILTIVQTIFSIIR